MAKELQKMCVGNQITFRIAIKVTSPHFFSSHRFSEDSCGAFVSALVSFLSLLLVPLAESKSANIFV